MAAKMKKFTKWTCETEIEIQFKKTKQVSYASKRSETDGNILHSLS